MSVDLRDDNVSEYEFKLWRQYHAAAASPAIIPSTATETEKNAARVGCQKNRLHIQKEFGQTVPEVETRREF